MRKTRGVAIGAAMILGASTLLLGLSSPTATAASGQFANTALITIPPAGAASLYPSSISVAGLRGAITDVNVSVDNVGHTNPDDLDVVVVSPSGDSVVVMSDACNGADSEDLDWTFDDEAAGAMPDTPAGTCASGTYQPSVYDGSSDTWPGAFPGPHGTALSDFDGENALGTWHLYVHDDSASDSGDIERGWMLTITTGSSNVSIPSGGTSGSANPYPRTLSVNTPGIVTDVNVVFSGVFHSRPDDLDVLLVGPGGAKTILMSDACGSFDVENRVWRWDDEAPAVMTDDGTTDVCAAGDHRPTDHTPGDDFPSPAPAGPYPANLGVFDLAGASGSWSFYINDDLSGDAGFLVNLPALEITTRPPAHVKFTGATTRSVVEGATTHLTISRTAAGPTGAASVGVTTQGAGTDDVTFPQVVNFAPGETSKDVPLTIIDDSVAEHAASFGVVLSYLTSGDADVGSPPSTVIVTIAASDLPLNTTFTKVPRRITHSPRAKLKFISTTPGSTFKCKVDKKPWKPCKSPLKLKNLKRGTHVVLVRATDPNGLVESTPAIARWGVR